MADEQTTRVKKVLTGDAKHRRGTLRAAVKPNETAKDTHATEARDRVREEEKRSS